jgi:hypothetical protein
MVGDGAREGLIPNFVSSFLSTLLGLNNAARSGSNEPKLKLRWSPRSPLTTPPTFGGLFATSSTTTPSTPFNQSRAVRTSFAIMASSTSAVSLDVDRSSAEVSPPSRSI